MHDFYVNQLHHHSPHATMHTIHAIYFFFWALEVLVITRSGECDGTRQGCCVLGICQVGAKCDFDI